MPKAGYSSKDLAPDTGFGFEKGRGEVVEAVVKVHQYPKSQKEPNKAQSAPFICVQLGLIHLNDKLERMDDEVKYVQISIGSKGLEHFSVGMAKNAEDENPVDLGQEVDVTGNCIFVRDEGTQIHPKTGWGTFVGEAEMKSADGKEVYKGLQKAGFKPEVLGQGFIPDLVGMKGWFGNAVREKWEGYQGEKDPTVFMVREIYVYPYDVKKSKGAPAAKTAAKSATPAGAPATSGAATPGSNGAATDGDLMKYAVGASLAVVEDVKGQKIDLKTFRTKVQQKLLKQAVKPPSIHPKILDLLKSGDTTAEIGAEAGFMVDEDGMVVWPE